MLLLRAMLYEQLRTQVGLGSIKRVKCVLKSNSSEETEAIAASIGNNLKGREVLELISDLGGGKTTFVRGLAKGFKSSDKVASPTFTVSKVYKAGKKELHHFDFYRLHDAGIMSLEIAELIGEPDIIVVIEWAQAVKEVLPKDRLTVELQRTDDESRELIVTCPESLDYLMENVC